MGRDYMLEFADCDDDDWNEDERNENERNDEKDDDKGYKEARSVMCKAEKKVMARTTPKYQIGDIVRLTEAAIKVMNIEGFEGIRDPLTIEGIMKLDCGYGIEWEYEATSKEGHSLLLFGEYFKKYDGSEDGDDIPYKPRTFVEMTEGDKYYKAKEEHKAYPWRDIPFTLFTAIGVHEDPPGLSIGV